jgi:hypothetical protein
LALLFLSDPFYCGFVLFCAFFSTFFFAPILIFVLSFDA